MRSFSRNFIAGFIPLAMTLAFQSDVNGQYPVAVQPVMPAVVGYTAERRGLFGRRVIVRPIVGQVAAVVPVAPVVVAARPIVAAPAVVAPITMGYAPAVSYYRGPTPVATYYRGPVPVATYYRAPAPILPIRAYRVHVNYGYGF